MLRHFKYNLINNCFIKKNTTIIVAVSGGPDSIALLDLLDRSRNELSVQLIAAHINHHLRDKESDQDQKLVEKICSQKGITLEVADWKKPDKGNIEDEARNFRRDFLAELARSERGVIATGHNADDNVECFFLHLARGCGLKGLRGIEWLSFYRGTAFIRPLLDIDKYALAAYCKKRGLKTALDKTNKDTRLMRNYIRHDIIPLFLKRNQNFNKCISRLCTIIREDDDYMEQIAASIPFKTDEESIIWERKMLKELPPPIKRRVIAQGYENMVGSRKDLLYDHLRRIDDVLNNTGCYSLPSKLSFSAKGHEARLAWRRSRR